MFLDSKYINLNSVQLKNNYINIYNDIITYNKNFNGDIISFAQQKYNYINDIINHPRCKVCSKKVRFQDFKHGYKKFCSNKCAGIYKKNLSKEDKNKILKKRQETCLTKYGVDNVAKSNLIKEKIQKTCLNKYGYITPLKNDIINSKRQNTFLKNWGSHPLSNEKLIKKRSQTRKNTMSSRWEKSIRENYSFLNFKNFNYLNRNITIKCDKCNNEYTIHHHILYQRYKSNIELCTICNPLNSTSSSKIQNEILEFLINECHINKNLINVNNRTIISPLELDILIPTYNIAFEINGTYWHNELYKNKNYHQNKFLECKKHNIRLIQIWQDEWLYKQDIVKSRLLSLFNKTENIVYARKCKIKQLKYKEISNFLEENHLQGTIRTKLNYGLFYNDILISVMTFGKLRKSLGQQHEQNSYELYRFCSKLNYNVIGGATKLLKHFIRTNDVNKIITYSNLDWGIGNVYNKMDFKFNDYTSPSYYYIINGLRSHRYNWTKYKLVKMGYDKNKTEHEIMLSLGYYRIWTAGNAKWIWLNI